MNTTHWRHRAPRWMKVAAIWISHRIWKAHHWLTTHSFLLNLHLFLEWFGGYEESMRQFDLRNPDDVGSAASSVDAGCTFREVPDARLKCPACGIVFPLTANVVEPEPETPTVRNMREIADAIRNGDEKAWERAVSRKPPPAIPLTPVGPPPELDPKLRESLKLLADGDEEAWLEAVKRKPAAKPPEGESR